MESDQAEESLATPSTPLEPEKSLELSLLTPNNFYDAILAEMDELHAATHKGPNHKWVLVQLDTNEEKEEEKTPTSPVSSIPQAPATTLSSKTSNDVTNQIELIINLYGTSPVDVSNSSSLQTAAAAAASCPLGTFDCAENGRQCIPNSLRCNGEDNCGNGHDERLNCGTMNLFYVFNTNTNQRPFLDESGLWWACRTLLLLLSIALALYVLFACVRCLDIARWFCCSANSKSSPLYKGHYTEIGKSSTNPFGQVASPNAYGWFRLNDRGQLIQEANSVRSDEPPPHYQPPAASSDQGPRVNEHIYVTNNYGQPLGGTAVAPHLYGQAQCPLYPQQFPNYGGTKQ